MPPSFLIWARVSAAYNSEFEETPPLDSSISASMASTTSPLFPVDDCDDDVSFSSPLSLFNFVKLIHSSLQGFDWEAACREIDLACRAKNSSIACSDGSKPKICMQSTLDKFIRPPVTAPPLENGDTGDRENVRSDGDEVVCCVDIDVEAAKTWIYPGSFAAIA